MAELTKADLQERAMMIRTHEGNCKIEHPTAEELAFRLATMKKIAKAFGYAELKQYGFVPAPLPPRKPTLPSATIPGAKK